MVDRIVPATIDCRHRLTTTQRWGVHDAAPVMHEPFKQWAIEDDFAGGSAEVGRDAGAQAGRRRRPLRGV